MRGRAVGILAGLAGLSAAATGYGVATAARGGPADDAVLPSVISVPAATPPASPSAPPVTPVPGSGTPELPRASTSAPRPAPAPRPQPDVVDPPPAVDVAPEGDDDDDTPDDGDDGD